MIAHNNPFKPATRHALKLRAVIEGPSGSGKTFTALRMATALGQRVAVINTEPGSIRKYLGLAPDGVPFEFDIVEPTDFAPSTYTQLVLAAGNAYDVLIIDSLSHAWEGEGGALDQVDKSRDANRFTAWKDVTPQHRRMIEAITRSACHVIATMRTKTEYVLEANDKGKMVPKKIGTKPIQREGMEYEFDVVMDLNVDHLMTVAKSRCPEFDGLVKMKPDAATFGPLVAWLNDGSEPPEGYYARTEADLRAENKALHDAKPAEQRRNEAAAAQRAAIAANKTATRQPPAEKPDPTTSPISAGSIARIAELQKTTTLSREQMKDVLATKFKVQSSRELTELQALDFIGCLLQSQPSAGDTNARNEPPADQSKAEPQAEQPSGGELSQAPGSVTQEQLAELRALKDQKAWPLSGPGSQREYLDKTKAANFRGISEAQAAKLIKGLRKRPDVAGVIDKDLPF